MLKPLFVLLLFVVPYTLVAFIWWFVYAANTVWGTAGSACTNLDELNFMYYNLSSVNSDWIDGSTYMSLDDFKRIQV